MKRNQRTGTVLFFLMYQQRQIQALREGFKGSTLPFRSTAAEGRGCGEPHAGPMFRTLRDEDVYEGTDRKDLLDDLEERPVKLGKYLVAVFKLKANIVGLHPGYVLKKEEGREQDVGEKEQPQEPRLTVTPLADDAR